jgi:hypothetical protein
MRFSALLYNFNHLKAKFLTLFILHVISSNVATVAKCAKAFNFQGIATCSLKSIYAT